MSSSEQNIRGRRSTGKVTLADVAKVAGVGQMTVSRALRTPDLVSDNLRIKIENAILKLGYIPNSAARELASVASRNIVIVTSSITSTENTLILSALQKELQPTDNQLIILMATGNNWLRELINHSPLAIVLLNLDCPAQEKEWIKNSNVICIEIGAKQPEPIGINVCIDSKSAVQNMVNFLVQKGHREIGLLSANQNLAIFRQHLESWHTALLKKYMNPHLMLHCAEEISFSSGAKLLNDAILTWGNVDALVFLSDELACGALFEAHRKHLSVPYDFAIAGVGGLEISSAAYPRLTTIYIPYKELGENAGKVLVELLQQDNKKVKPEYLELSTRLIERDSA